MFVLGVSRKEEMKLFEVTTEYTHNKETIKSVEYVTSEANTIKSVVDYFAEHCYQYEKELIGVREVLVIVQHINKELAGEKK